MTDPRDQYASFLPADLRPDQALRPESTWWRRRDVEAHIERVRRPESPLRVLLIHGAGTHAAALWPLAGAIATRGVEVVVPDMPGYGRTRVGRPGRVRYDDWVAFAVDLARAEAAADPRPLVVFGTSMGGMIAYEVAARSGVVTAAGATCLLDTRDPAVRRHAARFRWLGAVARPALRTVAPVADNLRVPIRFLADMRAIANDPGLVRVVVADRLGGGGRVPLGFLRSFLQATPSVEPEDFTACPFLLTHPAADRWTPPELSIRFFDRIAAPKELVLLQNAGHYPVEAPGVHQLADALEEMRDRIIPG
ncbi:lysophospholipase [Actinoplanes cyaneus]|uniref:Lysophospholipase n=1 Tax=Actinoplanes cyaneus TaxID=52696 RepID=A0A919IKT8_9ACTN|nr:alpha/beta hydrolase [Actinoplanes cyaneus]MCW2141184.1 Lysophospholipase, alpha-beta hydrolase superfamily [Actinoplanes cyaneus]GID67248.1 lysophospholipase [Actinoplanes cyaneus]